MLILVNISTISAGEIENILTSDVIHMESANENQISVTPEQDLKQIINDSNVNDIIILEPGIYKVHNITITKNITLQGNGNTRDIIIDGENKSSIFLIRSPAVYATFKNITFINGLTNSFGGAISMETGNVYVDYCHFINNTALMSTNAGAISNYGDAENKGYLFVNNSLFINNHADHDGGAVTTCYANSDIYNSVFINNSARRDGGAIRVSVEGYGNVQDCIFMYNYAKEWGGAYYSWAGTSNIVKCIFLNNTGGTNGGAVMVSGNLNLTKSIIVNNTGKETGGSFYIQQPMFDRTTVINVQNNLITNNTSPYGKEIYIKWKDTKHLFTQFDDNDWGDEDPNDSSVIDPNNVTARSKVSSTIKSDLLNELDMNLLSRYTDLIDHYFPDGYLDEYKKQDNTPTADDNENASNQGFNPNKNSNLSSNNQNNNQYNIISNNTQSSNTATNSSQNLKDLISSKNIVIGNSTSAGENKNAFELNKKDSVAKQASSNIEYFLALAIVVFLALVLGYRAKNKE